MNMATLIAISLNYIKANGALEALSVVHLVILVAITLIVSKPNAHSKPSLSSLGVKR